MGCFPISATTDAPQISGLGIAKARNVIKCVEEVLRITL